MVDKESASYKRIHDDHCGNGAPDPKYQSSPVSSIDRKEYYPIKKFHHQDDSKRVPKRAIWHGGAKQLNWRQNTKQKEKEPVEKFIYGNFPHYYGYRNQDCPDMRLTCMKREWFEKKDVLDIGCNAGHFTLKIARDLSPKMIIGLDIDSKLVQIAKKNTKHYISDDYGYDEEFVFPLSFVELYGPVAHAAIPHMRNENCAFPFNVFFVQGNYVLESDELIKEQKPYFDTILCLSLTKWIHLNWGDVGVKRLFRQAYAQLRPGGHFILEAQPYSSYSKKKRISAQARYHYASIKFYPEMFNEFLLNEVGFETCELIDVPAHTSKGFSRPIYLFTKSLVPENKDTKTSTGPTHIVFDSDESSLSDAESNYDIEELSD